MKIDIKNKIFKIFKKNLDQNEKLIRNIERYEQKKKAEQQKSEVLATGQKRWAKNKK